MNKQTRKFHDPLSFVIPIVLYFTIIPYSLLSLKDNQVFILKPLYVSITVSLIISLVHIILILVFHIYFLKLILIPLPTIIILYFYGAPSPMNLFILLVSLTWLSYALTYWPFYNEITPILKHTAKLYLKSFVPLTFGFIIVSCIQYFHFYLGYYLLINLLMTSNNDNMNVDHYIFLLYLVMVFWTIPTLLYLYRSYFTSVIAFKHVCYYDNIFSIIWSSIKNTFFTLGSIFRSGNTAPYSLSKYNNNIIEPIYSTDNDHEFILKLYRKGLLSYNEIALSYISIHNSNYVRSMKEVYWDSKKNPNFINKSGAYYFSIASEMASYFLILIVSFYTLKDPVEAIPYYFTAGFSIWLTYINLISLTSCFFCLKILHDHCPKLIGREIREDVKNFSK